MSTHRALTVDNVAVEADDGPAVSAKIVADLRIAMNNTNNILSVPLQAYIIPETDAHQVCVGCAWLRHGNAIHLFIQFYRIDLCPAATIALAM